MPQLFIWGILALPAIGFFADKTGEGIDSTANGLIKIAVAGAIGLYVAKEFNLVKGK